MRLRFLAIPVAAIALPLAVQATGNTSTPGVDKREANQERRIQQGVQTGQVTPKEEAKLEKGQAKVRKMEANARADGNVTRKEREKIQHAQNKQSRKIAKQKHDKQKVGSAATAAAPAK